MTTRLLPAAGYIRLSHAAADDNVSLDDMERALHRLAAERGYTLVKILVDDGLSGAIRNRPEFLEWLAMAVRGEVVALLTPYTDRITREGVNAAAMVLDVVEGKDSTTGKVVRPEVRLLDTTGTDSDGDVLSFRIKFVLHAEMARAERVRIQERILNTQRGLRDELRHSGGKAPYGYRIVEIDLPNGKKGKGLAIEPHEALIVKQMVARALRGDSLYSIAEWLNSEGHKPRRADAWRHGGVQDYLCGEPILGRKTHKGKPLTDADGMPLQVWEPIITLDEALAVRAKIGRKPLGRNKYESRRKASRLLSGLLLCAGCGSRLVVRQLTHVSHERYNCVNGARCSGPVTLGADRVEAYIESELLSRFGHVHYIQRMSVQRDSTKVAELTAAINDMALQITQPGADVADLAVKISTLQARRDAEDATTEEVHVENLGLIADLWATADMSLGREIVKFALLSDLITVKRATSTRTPIEDRLTVAWRPAVPKQVGA